MVLAVVSTMGPSARCQPVTVAVSVLSLKFRKIWPRSVRPISLQAFCQLDALSYLIIATAGPEQEGQVQEAAESCPVNAIEVS